MYKVPDLKRQISFIMSDLYVILNQHNYFLDLPEVKIIQVYKTLQKLNTLYVTKSKSNIKYANEWCRFYVQVNQLDKFDTG